MKKVIFILCLLFILNNNNLIHAEEWIVNEESEIIINKNYQEIVTFPEYENILLLINHSQIHIMENKEIKLTIEGTYNTSKIIQDNLYLVTSFSIYQIKINDYSYNKYDHSIDKVNDIIYNYNIFLIGQENNNGCIYEYDSDFNILNKYLYGGLSSEEFTKCIYLNNEYYIIGLKDAHSLNGPFNNVGNKGDKKSFITKLNEEFEIINTYNFNQLQPYEYISSFNILEDQIHILLSTEDNGYKYKLSLDFDLIELYHINISFLNIYETISLNSEEDDYDLFLIKQREKIILTVYHKGIIKDIYEFKRDGEIKTFYLKNGELIIYITTNSGIFKITLNEYVNNINDDLIINRLNNDYNSTHHLNIKSYYEDLSFIRYESNPYFQPNINGMYEITYKCERLNKEEIYTTANIIVEPYVNIYHNGIYPTNISLLFFGNGYLNDQRITSGEVITKSGHYNLKIIDSNNNSIIYEFDCVDNYYKKIESINIPSIIEINKNEQYDYNIEVNKEINSIYVNDEEYNYSNINNNYQVSFNSSINNQVDIYNINYLTYYEKNILKIYPINESILIRTLKSQPIINIYEQSLENDLLLDIKINDIDQTLSYIQIDLMDENKIIETHKNFFNFEIIRFNKITTNKPYIIKTYLVYELGGLEYYKELISSLNITFNKYNQDHIILESVINDNRITNIKIKTLSKKILFNEVLIKDLNLSEKYQKNNTAIYLVSSIVVSLLLIISSIIIYIYKKRKL